MKTSHILLLCIVGAALVSTVVCQRGSNPEVCCFTFYPRRVGTNFIKSYNMTDAQCTRSGVILVTQKGHRICADPSVSWVQNIMNYLDDKSM